MANIFYVYEWFNIDTDEVFYVGKGSKSRYKDSKNRNNYFLNYHNKYNCNVRKISEGLSEKDAFSLEVELILKYRNINQCKCNITSGGEGSSGVIRTYIQKLRLSAYGLYRKFTAEFGDNIDIDKSAIKKADESELYDIIEELKWKKDGLRTFEFLQGEEGWECLED